MTQIECLDKLKKRGKVSFTQQNFSKHVAKGVIPFELNNSKKKYKYKKVLKALRKAGLLIEQNH